MKISMKRFMWLSLALLSPGLLSVIISSVFKMGFEAQGTIFILGVLYVCVAFRYYGRFLKWANKKIDERS